MILKKLMAFNIRREDNCKDVIKAYNAQKYEEVLKNSNKQMKV